MAENLQAFHARVDGFQQHSLPHDGGFSTSAGLICKVDEWGNMKPYFGNTVIYELPDQVKLALCQRQVLLHHRMGACLAVPLKTDTFHITLHDLISSPDKQTIAHDIERTGENAKRLLEELRCLKLPQVHMVSTHVFSMVNTSIVMGFAPESEADCNLLMGLYEDFQSVCPLNWGLTPHVTLAYYKPGYYGQEWVEEMNRVFREAEDMGQIHIQLSAEDLFYRTFQNMNTYCP